MKIFILTILLLFAIECKAQWTVRTPLTGLDQNKVSCLENGCGYILCDGGVLLFSTDNGTGWTSKQLSFFADLQDIIFPGDSVSYIIGDFGKVFRSEDNWQTYADRSISDYIFLKDAEFIDADHGIAVGTEVFHVDANSIYYPSINITSDGGLNWTTQRLNFTGKLNTVCCVSDSIFLAAGDEGLLIRSDDGGRSWGVQQPGTTADLTSINTCSEEMVVLCGDAGVFFYSTDRGVTWTSVFLPDFYQLKSACFNKKDKISAAGHKEISIYGIKYYLAFVAEYSLNTNQWMEVFCAQEGRYNSISFFNTDLALAVGDSGIIAEYGTLHPGNPTVINEKHRTNDFELLQNYPNPFNPSTTISYRISNYCLTTITIYDVTGSKVYKMTSDHRPGIYEFTWNAENLPGGIYFYKLQAGECIQIKKMVLIK